MAVTLEDVLGFIDREEPAYALGSMLGDEALPVIANLIAGDDEARATKATSLASAIGTPAAAEVLAIAANNNSATVRIATAAGMRQLTPDLATPILLALAQDNDIGVRSLAQSIRRDQVLAETLTFIDWEAADPGGATGALHDGAVTLTGPMGTAFYFHNTSQTSTRPVHPATRGHRHGRDQLHADRLQFSLEFQTPIQDPVLHLKSLGSIVTFDPGIQISRLSGSPGFQNTGSTVTGDDSIDPDESAGTVRLLGQFTHITFTTTPSSAFPGIPDGIFLLCGGSLPLPQGSAP